MSVYTKDTESTEYYDLVFCSAFLDEPEDLECFQFSNYDEIITTYISSGIVKGFIKFNVNSAELIDSLRTKIPDRKQTTLIENLKSGLTKQVYDAIYQLLRFKIL